MPVGQSEVCGIFSGKRGTSLRSLEIHFLFAMLLCVFSFWGAEVQVPQGSSKRGTKGHSTHSGLTMLAVQCEGHQSVGSTRALPRVYWGSNPAWHIYTWIFTLVLLPGTKFFFFPHFVEL